MSSYIINRTIIAFLTISIFLQIQSSAFAALSGDIKYNIPIDYSHLDENELSVKAETYYNQVIVNKNNQLDENTTSALNLYSILTHINPTNTNYILKLGSLYDKIEKDRYAKSNYYRAIGINPDNGEAYFYFGEFYYKREKYKKALKFYKKASSNGYSNQILNDRINTINKMLGI